MISATLSDGSYSYINKANMVKFQQLLNVGGRFMGDHFTVL